MQAEIEYEQLRKLCDSARYLMLDAALDNKVPTDFWNASIAVIKELELYAEHLRKVTSELVRVSILQYYGLPRPGTAGDSGLVTECDPTGNPVRSPDLIATISDDD